MSENFILWNVSFDEAARELSFFATAANVQLINRGTAEMVGMMLRDLGIAGLAVGSWQLSHFVTNYLADEPEEGDDWEDVWSLTWEIRLDVPASFKPELPDEGELARTRAYDETWEGDGSYYPCECVLIVDAPDEDTLRKLASLINEVRSGSANGAGQSLPPGSAEALAKIREAYARVEGNSGFPTTRRRAGHPLQLLMSLGIFDEEFFADGAGIAALVSDLCHAAGATTSWDEVNNPA
jgi:hypothetical protein